METGIIENTASLSAQLDEESAAIRLLLESDVHTAAGRAEEMLKRQEAAGFKKGIISALNQLAFIRYKQSRFDEVRELSRRALEMTDGEPFFLKERARSNINMGIAALYRDDFAGSLAHYNEALSLYSQTADETGIGNSHMNIGLVKKKLGDFKSALEHFEKGRVFLTLAGDETNLMNVYTNFGLVYANLGSYSTALEYYKQSLAIAQKSPNQKNFGGLYINIGHVYKDLGMLEQALEFYNQGTSLCLETGNRWFYGNGLQSVANIYSMQGDFKKALELYKQGLQIYEDLGLRQYKLHSLTNIAESYSELGDDEKALEHMLECLHIAEQNGSADEIAEVDNSLATLYNKIEMPEKAVTHLTRAEKYFTETDRKQPLADLYLQLANSYRLMEDFKTEAKYLRLHSQLFKKIFEEDTKKKLASIEFEKEILELQKKQELERQEQRITTSILDRIFPREIVQRLHAGESPLADYYPATTVLFLDLVDFTTIASDIPPKHLIYVLNSIFTTCDDVIAEFGLEKIKTIGDAYMAVAGVPTAMENHAEMAARAAVKIVKVLKELVVKIPAELEGSRDWIAHLPEIAVRIGLHCGEVIGGVIGSTKYAYDLWGDTVNIAARMESAGESNAIHCSAEMYGLLKNSFSFKERGEIEIKGKGLMKTYFLLKEY